MQKHTDTTLKVAFLVAALFSAAAGFSTSNFTETGECQGEQMCLYDYTVEQQYFAGEGQQNSSITVEVGIMCDSVGVYNEKDAVIYCMSIRDIEIQGTIFQDEQDANTEQAQQYRQRYILQTLSGHFCFVQTSDGKVPAVYYAEQQSDETVNFKKGIASAFQANFKGTETEEEIDPQSIHMAHYKRISTEQEGTVKMHRSVNGDDVIAYTTGAPKRDLKLTKEEDIEYQSGKLRHSAGNTSVKVSKSVDEEDQQSFSKLYSASGSYSLDLKECSPVVKRAYSRHRRSVRDEMEGSKMEESLKAKYNLTKTEIEEMEMLREKIPSVIDALFELTENHNDTKTVDTIERLLELENKHGPLPGFSPALSDVLEYYSSMQESTNPDDEHMRGIVYSFLVVEGSFQSQMVLLDALNAYTVSEEEKTLLINEIAMMKNPHLDFVRALKEYLYTTTDDMDIAEPLLLAFGALASRAPFEVEEFVVSSLMELEAKAKGTVNLTIVIPLILSMGNTGSKLVADSLLSYLDSTNKDIQIITLQALRKFSFNQEVLDKLKQLLAEQNDEDILAAVIEVLVMGLEYSTNFDTEHFDAHNDFLSHHPILTTLVMSTLEMNNTKFDALVEAFLKDVGGEQADSLLSHFHSLSKRGTDWDANNSVYNLVASFSDRRSDVNRHQKHRAYIWGKRFGINEANLEVAAGGFGGISNDCNYIKAYGRVVAKGNVLSRSSTFADVLVDLRKTPTTIYGRVYVYLAGNTLADDSRNYQLSSRRCYNYARQLAERRYRILRFSYSVFVYVGTLHFYVEMHATLSVGFDAQVCGQTAYSELVTATAGLTPRVGATVGGGVTGNLLSLARGGVSASASFVYQIEPRAEAEACRRDCSFQYQACAGIYDSWPGNRLDIETWYQTRTTRMCGRWIRYPCGITWGRRHRWDAFSWSWSLGSRGRRALYQSCYGTSNPQC